jgi:hypothetical protein
LTFSRLFLLDDHAKMLTLVTPVSLKTQVKSLLAFAAVIAIFTASGCSRKSTTNSEEAPQPVTEPMAPSVSEQDFKSTLPATGTNGYAGSEQC